MQECADILIQELEIVVRDFKPKTVEYFIENSKKRIKERVNREFIIEIPFLKNATDEQWEESENLPMYYLWLEDAIFKLVPTQEDLDNDKLFKQRGDFLLL